MDNPASPAPRSAPREDPEYSRGTKPPISLNLAFLIITIISIFMSIFFIYQNRRLTQKLEALVKSQPTPAPSVANPPLTETPSVDPTANWKTYTNKKFSYEFKYPNNWLLTEPCEENCRGPIPLSVKSPLFVHPDGQIVVEIQDPTCQGLANQSWSKSVKKTTTSIDGQSGLLILGKLDFNDNQLHDVKNICIPFDGQGYHFSMWSLNNPEDVTIFDQILSTFKFLGQSSSIDTSNWKTYTNNKCKYQISYPESWMLFPEPENGIYGAAILVSYGNGKKPSDNNWLKAQIGCGAVSTGDSPRQTVDKLNARDSGYGVSKVESLGQTTVNDKLAYKQITTAPVGDPVLEYYIFADDTSFVNIGFTPSTSKLSAEIQQIVSSFKFIK